VIQTFLCHNDENNNSAIFTAQNEKCGLVIMVINHNRTLIGTGVPKDLDTRE
jgi:hypothetical protein